MCEVRGRFPDQITELMEVSMTWYTTEEMLNQLDEHYFKFVIIAWDDEYDYSPSTCNLRVVDTDNVCICNFIPYWNEEGELIDNCNDKYFNKWLFVNPLPSPHPCINDTEIVPVYAKNQLPLWRHPRDEILYYFSLMIRNL